MNWKQTKIDTLTDLFDISSCKQDEIEMCDCTKGKKVPKDEWEFLQDQKSARMLFVGSVDLNITKRWQKSFHSKNINDLGTTCIRVIHATWYILILYVTC